MGYSSDYNSGNMEPNSVSLAMFASVGFHAVLFVLMAFFPAASETVKKPLRIVNLLPPSQTSVTSLPQNQAKTSTLEDILQNPLPDLSAGFPPVGNTNESSIQAAPDTSSYLGGNSSYNNRVNTSDIKIKDVPNQSFPLTQKPSSDSGTGKTKTTPKSTSNIQPAPNTSVGQFTPPPFTGNLSQPPTVIGAAPEPSGFNSVVPPTFPTTPNSGQARLNPSSPEPKTIPPSKQNRIPIISANVPYQYPATACPRALEGTATLAYHRQPDGTYADGSVFFENSSGSSLLDDVALNAVINSPASGTGAYQRYSSRFDFVYSKEVCPEGANNPAIPATPSSISVPTDSPSSNSEGETDDSKPSKKEKKQQKKESKSKKDSKDITPNPDTKSPTPPGAKDNPSKPAIAEPIPKPEAGQTPDSERATPPPKAEPIETPVNQSPILPSPTEPTQGKPPAPIPPQPVKPAAPSPVPETPVNPTPKPPAGNSSDLVPLEPVTPAPQPVAPAAPKAPVAPPAESSIVPES